MDKVNVLLVEILQQEQELIRVTKAGVGGFPSYVLAQISTGIRISGAIAFVDDFAEL